MSSKMLLVIRRIPGCWINPKGRVNTCLENFTGKKGLEKTTGDSSLSLGQKPEEKYKLESTQLPVYMVSRRHGSEEHCSDAAQHSSSAVDGAGLVPKAKNPVNCCNHCHAG